MSLSGTLTRNNTLPDSAAKADFYGLVDGATVNLSGTAGNSQLDLSAVAQNIVMSGAAINEVKGSVSSATTTDIGAVSANYVVISGTTTITGLGTIQAGTERTVEFSGALILTYDATKLILPGAANITTVAGDTAIFRSEGSGNWRCITYSPISGNPVVSQGGAGTLGSFKNLAGVWASNSTITYTADEIVLENSSNLKYIGRSLSATISSASNGAVNKLDAGTVANNTIYYAWAIYNGTTLGGLISTSSSSPTLPSGYTYKALIGCVGTNNSGNFIKFHQAGRKYTFDAWGLLASGNVNWTSWHAIDLTPANMSTNACFVPSALSTFAFGSFGSGDSASGTVMTNDSSVATTGTLAPNKLESSYNRGAIWAFDILTADTVYWGSNDSGAGVYLHGFEINKLS